MLIAPLELVVEAAAAAELEAEVAAGDVVGGKTTDDVVGTGTELEEVVVTLIRMGELWSVKHAWTAYSVNLRGDRGRR